LRLIRHHDEIALLERTLALDLPSLTSGRARLRIAVNADSLATFVISALAATGDLTRSFVNRLLRLTLLAPDIVEAILDGRQPKVMQLEDLTRVMLTTWDEQKLSCTRFWP